MTVRNYLGLNRRPSLDKADAVFMVSHCAPSGRLEPRPVAHAALVTRATSVGKPGDLVKVLHMTHIGVEEDTWTIPRSSLLPICKCDPADAQRCGLHHGPRRTHADLAGKHEGIDPGVRNNIIDHAVRFSWRRPRVLDGSVSYYLAGTPQPDSHPCHAGVKDAYGLSCAGLVAECYASAGAPLVDYSQLPEMGQDARLFYASLNLPVQTAPCRRLSCRHLISAFQLEPVKLPLRSPVASTLNEDRDFFGRFIG